MAEFLLLLVGQQTGYATDLFCFLFLTHKISSAFSTEGTPVFQPLLSGLSELIRKSAAILLANKAEYW